MVAIREQLVKSRAKTYSGTNPVKFYTIHETANTKKGANAAAHANLQSKGNVRNASWHWQIDDVEAVRSFPKNVQCWHAGDGRGPGNLESEAFEICVNSDGDFRKAVENTAKVVAMRIQEDGNDISAIRNHTSWSGKNCPTYLLSGTKGVTWADFINMVKANLDAAKKTPTKPAQKTVAQLAQEVIQGVHGNGPARRKSLGALYDAVQAEVNRLLLGTSTKVSRPRPNPYSKTIAQMASEVIAGKHGNGHQRRRTSLGVSYAVYEQVRREVNRRLR